jgi:hypothetical protein
MFNFIKNWFTPQPFLEFSVTQAFSPDNATLVLTEADETPKAEIKQRKNGKFLLCVNENEVVGEYTRRSSAIRAANRKGFTIND